MTSFKDVGGIHSEYMNMEFKNLFLGLEMRSIRNLETIEPEQIRA